MRVGVGFSDNPDTAAGGRAAVHEAFAMAGASAPCDLILLFSTARHDAHVLRAAVAEAAGEGIPIVGGGAVGAIVNDRFGYAGDQIALAAVWLEGAACDIVREKDIQLDEEAAGARLGRQLAARGVDAKTPVMLFYDAIDRSGGDMRLVLAAYLLAGLQKELGFLPDLNGAGLQGDYMCTPTEQWTGADISAHNALALIFGGGVRVDSTIMHGCRPVTGYYTVTKADRQTILKINGRPALTFMKDLLGPGMGPEHYPFFLILGMNRGDKWGEFDEEHYANRLCIAVDKERDGIVMFEPDMVEGTEFQVMCRSMELDYMVPRIEAVFDRLEGRRPVFAMYIDCAGRAAAQAGMELEDAAVVQKTVAGRVPLLGLYTGVEIASVRGTPRGLDWTGVFCLFSVAGDRQ